MSRGTNMKILAVFLALSTLFFTGAVFVGCSGDQPKEPGARNTGPAPENGDVPAAQAAPVPRANRATGTAAPVPTDLPPLPVRDIQERDFAESPSNRDPFRSYADAFKTQTGSKKITVQREVLINKYALDELKIVGIVNGGAGRVLIDDPTGLGWVVKVGDFIGKPEVVRSGGTTGADVSVNWRVDRIRPNDVVFVREDPSRPDVPATTRILSLRTAEELNPEIRTGVRQSAPNQTVGPVGPGGGAPQPAKGGG